MASILGTLLALMLCAGSSFSERYVPVSTSSDLVTALAGALPGDRIHLLNTRPLIVIDSFFGVANGTTEEPITIEGQGLENAYLSSLGLGYGALEITGNNWIVRNFTISESYNGLYLTGSNNVIEYITFQNIRHSGYGLWMLENNSNNTIRKCVFQMVADSGTGIFIAGSTIGNNIISNEFVAVGGGVVGISISGSNDNCCGYIAGNIFYRNMDFSAYWKYFVIHNGGFYLYHNNHGSGSLMYDGFNIVSGQSNEFRGNHCDWVQRDYCIYQDVNASLTFVYSDNTCRECVALTNVPIIDA